MKIQLILLIVIVFCGSCSKREKLVVGSFDRQKIVIIDKKSGEIEWTYNLSDEEMCFDVEVTSKKDVLYAYKHGAKLITRDHKQIWDYRVSENEELYTATRLESGNFLLGISGSPARIVELDKNGDIIKEIKFNTAIPDVSRQFRHIKKTPQNTYLIPLMNKHKISEIDENGRYIKSIFCGGTPNAVVISDSLWVVSCGDARSFKEIDPKSKKIIRTVETKDLVWGKLQYLAEIERYSNGNTLIANYNIDDDRSQPLLLEIDPDNKIAWQLPYKPEITNISTVFAFFE